MANSESWFLVSLIAPVTSVGLLFPGTPSSAQAGTLVLAVPSWNRSPVRPQPKLLISLLK